MLVKITEFVLTNNYFELRQKVFHHISGITIDTKFAPSYACISMDKFETNFLKTQKLQPFVWFRYIDDVFFIWNHGKEELENFMEELISFSDHIKFTFESDKENINYLDVNINLSNGHLMTNMHVKPTDRHQYLDYSSPHHNHIKRSVVYSQTLRPRRLCSLESEFLKHCTKMKSWFLKRGYPENMIDEEMKKVKSSEKSSNNSKGSKGVPFVVIYHPSLNCLSRILKENLSILYMNREAKAVFSPGLMVSFRSARRISSYLVRAKLYPLERRYEVCTNVTETDTFSSTVTGDTFQINHELNCDDKYLIYLLKCKVCNKQYVGETTDAFRLSWNKYKDNERKFQKNECCMQQHLYEHFYSEGQNRFLGNVSISLIDKTDRFQPKKRENYWMRTLKTLAPLGFNVESAV